MSNLASRFRHLRRTRHLSQSELASKATVARTTVVAVERGRNVSLPVLRQCARVLRLADDEWLALLVDWIHAQVGRADFGRLTISTGFAAADADPVYAQLRAWVDTLTPDQAGQLAGAIGETKFFPLISAVFGRRPNWPGVQFKVSD